MKPQTISTILLVLASVLMLANLYYMGAERDMPYLKIAAYISMAVAFAYYYWFRFSKKKKD